MKSPKEQALEMAQKLISGMFGKTGAETKHLMVEHLEPLLADKARLDWIQKSKPVIRSWRLHQDASNYHIKTQNEFIEATDIRTAIDQAMAKDGGK